jgi:hypothetical protein
MSPILDEAHDFAHPVEGDSAWSESYYFNGYDPSTDSGLFTRIGVRPNEGTMDATLSVWLPGGGMASVVGVREQREMTDDDLAVAGVRYDRLAPLKEWRLTCDADASVWDLSAGTVTGTAHLVLDLTFSALTPAIGVDGKGQGQQGQRTDPVRAATASTVGRGHLEQAGGWSGAIEVDGRRHELGPDARGNRDKSWGPRRWGGPRLWRWFSVNVGDDVHFGGIRIGTEGGDLHRGWVWRDGEATSVREWDVRTELADDGITHRVSHVRATDKKGRVHELRGDVLRVFRATQRTGDRTTRVNEGLARWSYEGRTGHGIAEYLHQLDEDGRPLVPVE